MSEDKIVVPAKRNKRVPFGVARTKLAIEQTLEGYHMHWVNDTPGRIGQAMAGDYTFVDPKEINLDSTRDNKVTVLVGTQEDGSPMNAYLMKIPLEFYYDDQEAGQKPLDQIDNAIRGGQLSAPGDSSAGRYVPAEGISYKTK